MKIHPHHLDAHLVAQLRPERGERGVVQHFDFFGERHALRIGHDGVAELVDEAIAFEQKRRRAERKVHLRRGEPFRPVFPAGVIHGHRYSLGQLFRRNFDSGYSLRGMILGAIRW